MSVANSRDNGNKGNNFPYQLGALQLLSAIASASAPPGGLATEVTLLQVLAAIQNGKEFEQNLVIDSGDPACPISGCPTYLQVRIWDTVTHSFGAPRYFDANGTEFFLGGNPLYGPMLIVNPQYVLENILTQVTAIDADTSVLATPVTGLAVNMLRVAGAGNVAAGKRSAAFYNAGNADATVLGAVLKPGEQVSFSADGLRDTLAVIAYNGTGTDLLITTVG